jgi:hypothetical protein
MGWWYWIGVSAGLGAAFGVFISGLPLKRTNPVVDGLAALVVGGLVGLSITGPHRGHWSDIAAGALGCLGAFVGTSVIVQGAFRRGGTSLGLAIIMFALAFVVGLLAFIPVVGYLEAVALVLFAGLLRRNQPERYAGLRTLAKD